jgi:hypothetical protein
MLKFNDGVEFNLDGELRPVRKKDGWYVVGHGMMMPVDSYEEAIEFMAEEEERESRSKQNG